MGPKRETGFSPVSKVAQLFRPQARDNGIAALQVELRTAPGVTEHVISR